jgi:hypothetical protein
MIRRLPVRASRRSNAASRSVEGRSVDHWLPMRCTSPAASSARSRESTFVSLRPAALAIRAVECVPAGSSRRARLSRSSRGGDDARGGRRGRAGAIGASTTGGGGSDSSFSVILGRHAGHVISASRPSRRSTSSRRQLRPVWQLEQRRPACSISVRSSAVIEELIEHSEHRQSRRGATLGSGSRYYSARCGRAQLASVSSAIRASSSGTSARRLGRFTTMPSCVLRASTTTASSDGEGFSSRCGTYGGTYT